MVTRSFASRIGLRRISTVALALCFLGSPVVHGQEDLRTRLQKEAGASWEAMHKESLADLRCEGVLKQVIGTGSPEKHCDVRFVRKGEFALLVKSFDFTRDGRSGKKVFVYCRGPQYSFSLVKDDDSVPFIVQSFTPRSQTEPSSIFLHVDLFKYRLLKSSVSAAFGEIGDRVREEAFVVTGVKRSDVGERPGVTVDFTYTAPDARSNRGALRFDPTHNWAIVGYHVEMSDPGASGSAPLLSLEDREASYTLRHGRIILDSFHITHSDKGKVRESYDWTLKDVSFAPIDDSEFTLSAFGLPEVSVEAAAKKWFFSSLPWVFWACLAGAIFGAVGLWIKSGGGKNAAMRA